MKVFLLKVLVTTELRWVLSIKTSKKGINKTYHPHNDDKIEAQNLDIALTRSFHDDP